MSGKRLVPTWNPFRQTGTGCTKGLRPAITALLAKGMRPVSINSYLTGVRACLNLSKLAPRRGLPAGKAQATTYEIRTESDCDILAGAGSKAAGAQAEGHKSNPRPCGHVPDARYRPVTPGGLGLTRADVDFDNLAVKVNGKGNKERGRTAGGSWGCTWVKNTKNIRTALVI